MNVEEIQPVSDENGQTVDSESETAYVLKSPNMTSRILEAKDRQEGIGLEEAREKLSL